MEMHLRFTFILLISNTMVANQMFSIRKLCTYFTEALAFSKRKLLVKYWKTIIETLVFFVDSKAKESIGQLFKEIYARKKGKY